MSDPAEAAFGREATSSEHSNGTMSGVFVILWAWFLCLPRVLLKTLIVFAVGYIFFQGNGLNWLIALVVGFFPLGRSAVSAATGLGDGWFMRNSMGARPLSEREKQHVDGLLDRFIAMRGPGTRRPGAVFVLETSETHNSFALGRNIYVYRGAVGAPHFPGILAHELGHVSAFDARVNLAINALEPQALNAVRELKAGSNRGVLSSGFRAFATARPVMGKLFFGWVYAWWSRRREFAADHFAAECGAAVQMINCLEDLHTFDAPTPWGFGQTHPYTEFRIDRLQTYLTSHPDRRSF
jgi:Zn-dependent protease with chaperone function